MIEAQLPENERQRLECLYRYEILDSDPEIAFDRITDLVSDLLSVPIALVSLVDADRQWFKSTCGLDVTETDRRLSFCAHAIHDENVMVVPDATADPRFKGNPLVSGEPSIRFYTGAPLITSEGFRLGTLCAVDSIARVITNRQIRQLGDLAQIVVDEMELRLAAIKLARAGEKAECASAAKSAFISSLSHEIRTPLNAILGYGQLMQAMAENPKPDRLNRAINNIVENGQHVVHLIEQATEMSKIEAGELSVSPSQTDVLQVLDECLNAIRTQAVSRGITISNHSEIEGPCLIETDAMRLKQIILNLLSNAVKYNQDDGRITVALSSQSNSGVRMMISDTGIGIPENMRDRVFKAFDRLGQTGSGIEGTGIGLAITRELVVLLGGTLDFCGNADDGTDFWFDLPSNYSSSLQD